MTVRTIEVDDDVFAEMQARAVPLVDTPNTVLRRLLGLSGDAEAMLGSRDGASEHGSQGDGGSDGAGRARRRSRRAGEMHSRKGERPKRRRAATGTIAPESIYRIPILEALDERGGRAPKREALDAVGKKVAGQLLEADHEIMGNEPRWKKRAQFMRLRLIQEGLMEQGSPRGLWEITDAGRALVASGSGS